MIHDTTTAYLKKWLWAFAAGSARPLPSGPHRPPLEPRKHHPFGDFKNVPFKGGHFLVMSLSFSQIGD